MSAAGNPVDSGDAADLRAPGQTLFGETDCISEPPQTTSKKCGIAYEASDKRATNYFGQNI